MKTIDQFKKIIEHYYNRDEHTKEQYKDFKNQYSISNLKSFFDSLPEIEEKLRIRLPQDYKTFIEADSAWFINGEMQQLGIYDEKGIYELNHIGSYKGDSSFEELKDFYLFGQDYGEQSYFFDPFNKLGYGTDAVWRVNRGSLDKRDFELVANDFYELVEKFCKKEDGNCITPFKNENYISDGFVIRDFLIQKVEANPILMKKIKEMQEKIEGYFSLIKNARARIKKIRYFDINEEKKYRLPSISNLPLEILYIIQRSLYFITTKDYITTSLCDESLIERNYGKYSLSILKDMFVFATCDSSHFVDKNINAMDYFFVDPSNILGKGSDAVYIICNRSKELDEACYVAKDIVDFFRIFVEDKQINTTPIRISSLS